MTHRRSVTHSFRCDHEDEDGEPCLNRITFSYGVRKSSAVGKVREFGWAAHRHGHFCPEHNTKGEPEEDPHDHHRVEYLNYGSD